MKILILYVLLCDGGQCNSFEPMSWALDHADPIATTLARKECNTLAAAYSTLVNTDKAACYVEQE